MMTSSRLQVPKSHGVITRRTRQVRLRHPRPVVDPTCVSLKSPRTRRHTAGQIPCSYRTVTSTGIQHILIADIDGVHSSHVFRLVLWLRSVYVTDRRCRLTISAVFIAPKIDDSSYRTASKTKQTWLNPNSVRRETLYRWMESTSTVVPRTLLARHPQPGQEHEHAVQREPFQSGQSERTDSDARDDAQVGKSAPKTSTTVSRLFGRSTGRQFINESSTSASFVDSSHENASRNVEACR